MSGRVVKSLALSLANSINCYGLIFGDTTWAVFLPIAILCVVLCFNLTEDWRCDSPSEGMTG